MSSNPLLHKVLPNVFKFLPIDDRKNVRLSCHEWNDACNNLEIIMREKFVFHRGNVAYVKVCFAKCKILRFDFEFYGLSLQHIPSAVWKYAGASLKSLFIYDCELDDDTISDIIFYCSDLTSLSVVTPPGPYEPDRLFCSESVLDALIRHEVVQRNLQSFQLFTLIYVSPRMYRKIFEIYPNIQTFGLGNSNAYTKEKLVLPQMIENFAYPFGHAGEAVVKQLNEHPRLKLKELEIGPTNFKMFGIDLLLDFISQQTELEKVKLSITGFKIGIRTDEKTKALLFRSISLPKLKEYELHIFCDVYFTADEFSKFLVKISRLESLSLRFQTCQLRSNLGSGELKLPSIVCDQLKTLQLEFNNKTTDSIYTEILKRCPSLRCLHLKEVNYEVLQRIFKDHTGLRRLSLFNRKKCSADPSKNSKVIQNKHIRAVKYSFNRLRNLEHLDVRGIRSLEIDGYAYDVFDAFFSQFDFPNLKCFYFHLRPCDELFVRRLLNLVSKRAPRLEILKLVSSHFVSGDELVNYCKKLKELKIIDIASPFFERKMVEKLFVECPSLRYVGEFHYIQRTYSYDRISKTLKKFDYRYLQTFYESSIPDDF